MNAVTTTPKPPATPERVATPAPASSPELAELLDDLSRAETAERQRRELEAATRPPRGAD